MSEDGAAEAVAEANTIEAESQKEEIQKASAENEEKDVKDTYSSGEEAEDGEGKKWSVSSRDYENGEENKPVYDGKVISLKEARARSREKGAKGKDISDTVKSAGKASQFESFFDKNLEDVLEDHFLDSEIGLWVKETANIVKGYLDVEAEEDAYRKIQEASKHTDLIAILAPGLGSFPVTGKHIERYTGIPTIRIRRKDGRLNDFLNYSMKTVGKAPIVIAYSSGHDDIRDHVKKYGHDNISMIYCVDSDKGDMEKYVDPKKIVYVSTNTPLMEPFEALFGGHSKAPTICPVYTLPKTTVHSSVVVGKDARFLGDIIRQTAKAKYHNFEPTMTINSSYLLMPMKKAA
ncbi:hypothetical protein J4458_04510 [Candidatus Woesearchaeota archaeon]|nr:hypothetical protein [Candidatus Woesearchaeota archaeon]